MSDAKRTRITRAKYEKARRCVAAARSQVELVRVWDDAVKRIGDLGNQQLVAVTIEADGSVRTECELLDATKPEAGSP